MGAVILILWGVAVGFLIPLQAGINRLLSGHLRDGITAGLFNFLAGAVTLFLIFIFRSSSFPNVTELRQVPFFAFLGGVVGASLVVSSIFLIERLGAASMIVLIIFGQVCGALILDHYGALGLEHRALDWQRIIGAFLVFLGVLLINLRWGQ